MTTTAITSSLLGIQASSSTDTTSTTTSATATDFITLLLAELKNQDPTDPMDTAELTSQFASLSLVQEAVKTNDYLETLSQYASSINNSSAVSCVGKTVTADTSSITVSDGTAQALSFSLSGDASAVTLTIYDADGNSVRTIGGGSLSSGSNSLSWDGTDSDGNTVADGTYSFKVTATDTSGNSVTASTSITAAITGVLYSGGTAYLVTSSGGKIAYGDVTSISSS
jgi:flagellar basal-body rod modification protein FlgD